MDGKDVLVNSEAVLLPTLSAYLRKKLVREAPSAQRTAFHALRPPPISVEDYLKRILKYNATCSQANFVAAVVYMERSGVPITVYTVHRLLISAVLISNKFYEDRFYNNKFFAKMGGLLLEELNFLEREMLELLKYNLLISEQQFEFQQAEIMATILCSDAPDAADGRRALLEAGVDVVELVRLRNRLHTCIEGEQADLGAMLVQCAQ
ncbi:Cyclin-U4-1 [Porphyridium purpureum]|uniref:Cyclin-U4-1 n=1 Tax=Porphyridium purpureum TaxID=35688 RepID=A0A5J4Z281_PORPP|nr:Cyclin-U4-1 [Porphyridium purpureum]|eukprot:POR9447..scf208_2